MMGWAGRPILRLEDPPLVRGQGHFTADLPARFRARFVRSAVAAGRIVRITPPAGATVFTIADLAGVKPIRPMLHKFGYIPIEQPVLADGLVRYVGDPVAVVVDDSDAVAEDIADRVEVEIIPTIPITTAREAVASGAALVRAEVPGNVVVEAAIETDGRRAATTRAHRVIACTVRSNRQNASPLEPRAAHAVFDPASGRVTLTCTTQTPHMMRTIIADLLGIREADLRVIAPDVGGGFGQKMSLAPEFVVLVWLARHLRASIAWTEDRRENLMASFHARDMDLSVTGAFDAGAKLIALTGDVLANVGAYAPYPNTAAVEPLMSLAELPGPYRVAEYACRVRGVVTNTCSSAPYRGVARPALTFAMERLMDKAARAFGIEPWEIRRRNLVATFPYVSPTGLTYDPGTYRETMERALSMADAPAFRARQAQARAAGRHLGIGLSTFCERTGYGSPAFAARGMDVTPGWETVRIAMDPSGAVEARIGASPHGQGLETALAQIIADELGVTPAAVRVIHGDTDTTPYGWGTFASRSLVIAGGASLLAARKVRTKLLTIAATMLEADAADITLGDDAARVAGTDRAIPIATLARASYHQAHRFEIEPGLGESA
ncbi:MAG TPA: xanthine dehydrogenase family protein molybdopterin-binding subunit, partial [Acetobacteraceae bacterium]